MHHFDSPVRKRLVGIHTVIIVQHTWSCSIHQWGTAERTGSPLTCFQIRRWAFVSVTSFLWQTLCKPLKKKLKEKRRKG